MSRRVLLACCLLIVGVSGRYWQLRAQEPSEEPAPPSDPPLLTVNGKPVPKSSFDREVTRTWRLRVADRLVRDRLAFDAAAKRGIEVTRADIDREMTRRESDYANRQAFLAAIAEQGHTPDSYRKRVQVELLLDRMIEAYSTLSDQEVEAYYESNRDKFSQPLRIDLAEIVCEDIETAYEARQRLASGESFAAVCAEVSTGETKDAGGRLGALTKGTFGDEDVWAKLAELPAGDVTDPIDAGDKYRIYQVVTVHPAKEISLDEARKQIKEALGEEKQLSRADMERLLIIQANVQINDPGLKPLGEAYAQAKKIRIMVNGRQLLLQPAPTILPSGHMTAPIRPVLEALELRPYWDDSAQVLRTRGPLGTVELTCGSNVLRLEDGEIEMPIPAELREGTVQAHPRIVLEKGFGAKLKWSAPLRTLSVQTGEPETAPAEPEPPEGVVERPPEPPPTPPEEPEPPAEPEPPTEPEPPAVANSIVIISTAKGDIEIKLFDDDAPKTVQNFLKLIREGFYGGLTFHHVEPGYFVQGGDPQGDGTGGPGYTIEDEVNDNKHVKGALAMATVGGEPNSAGSQFYVCLEAQPYLDEKGIFTVFGVVTRGMEVVEQIEAGDKMEEVHIAAERKQD